MSGQQNSLPPGWTPADLSEIAQPTRPRHSPQDYPSLPFIGMENVEAHTMRLLGTVPAQTMRSSAVHFFPGDVLYGRLRPYLNKVLCPDFEGLCSAEFIVLPKSEYVDSKFIQYRLNSADFVSFASHLNTGDRPRVDFEQISQYRLAIPPLPQQRRIVAEIEKQFTRLEAGVAALRRMQANLKRYRAAVLKAAVEGRLVPTEAELAEQEGRSCEPANEFLKRTLAERRSRWEGDQLAKFHASGKEPKDENWKAKYKELPGRDTNNLLTLPGAWTCAPLGLIADLKGGLTKGQKRKPTDVLRAVPYLRVANVQRGYLDLTEVKTIEATEEEIADLQLLSGDVLFNEGGDRDKLGRGWIWNGQIQDCIHQNHVFRARLGPNTILPKFLSWYGNSVAQRYFNDEGKQTTNLASLNMTKLSMLPVPIPPLIEQGRIVAEVDRRLSVTDELEMQAEANLKRAERLRQAILKRAFEGKLVPRGPDDESATVLLQQIRAQEEANGNMKMATKRSRKKSESIEAEA